MSTIASETPTAATVETGSRAYLPLVPIYEDDDLLVSLQGDPQMPDATLCFAGIGLGMGGVQPAEFVGSAAGETRFALHVVDKSRSWFNNFPASRLVDVIAPMTAGKTVVSLGNSMGGFGAIWVTRHVPVDVAIAFAPQYSVHPDIVPNEQRWRRWRRRITRYETESLADCFVPATRYYTFNARMDSDHWKQFADLPNCRHTVIDRIGHGVAKRLKAADALVPVIADCMARVDPLATMTAHGLTVERVGNA